MAAAGAAERDVRYVLPSGTYSGMSQASTLEPSRNGAVRALQHEVTHRRIVARQRSQRLVPMRVGQEPAVDHDVDIERQPVLVAEALDRDLQPLAVASLSNAAMQLGLS